MPAHAKATIIGVSLTIPITEGRLNMGIWQGIYLCEFRNHGGGRKIVATVMGDFLRQGNILNALNYICSFLFSNEFSSVFKNWYKVKKRVLIKVELIYFFK